MMRSGTRRGRARARRLHMLLISAAALLVIAGILSYLFIFRNAAARNEENYHAALQQYVSHIEAGEYEAMYALLDDASRMLIDEETFITRNQNIYTGIEARNIELEWVGEWEEADAPENAIATHRIGYRLLMDTLAGPVSFTQEAAITAIREEGQIIFRIGWSPGLIFPDLGWEDSVRVSTVTGTRGAIYDRNGELLAGPGLIKAVGFVPGKMNEDATADIAAVAAILDMTVESIENRLNQSWVRDDFFVPLRSLREEDVERKEQLLQIKGILIRDEMDRLYPLGSAAAHLTGYLQAINAEELAARPGQSYHQNSKLGKIGMEALLEERIRGIDGCKIVIQDAGGNKKSVVVDRPVVNGSDVMLTIDSALQQKLYDLMAADKGTAAVLDYRTGEVLALVSTPAYDPNEFTLGLTENMWRGWNDDPARPLYNRFKAAFVPGSSFKPITAAIGIGTGLVNTGDNLGYHGRSWQPDQSWGGYSITTLEEYGNDVTMRNALVYSDNIYFAKAALRIGADRLAAELRSLGFYEDVPFSFGLTQSSFGAEGVFASDIELADSGYGQGKVLVNPLHMAALYMGILNQGDVLAPQLEKGTTPVVWKAGAFTQEAADAVRGYLIEIVEDSDGTAHEVYTEGRTLGGKTGTAEIKQSQDDETGTELGWFLGFCEENGLLFVGMVEDVLGRGGSHYVTPIGKAILTE